MENKIKYYWDVPDKYEMNYRESKMERSIRLKNRDMEILDAEFKRTRTLSEKLFGVSEERKKWYNERMARIYRRYGILPPISTW